MTLLKSYRAIVIFNLLVVFLQFIVAGQMLGGSDFAVNLHGTTGLLLILIAIAQTAVAIVLRTKGIGPTGLIVTNIGIILAEAIEAVCGHFHIVALHVPLAVAIFGGVMRQLFWSVREALATRELRA